MKRRVTRETGVDQLFRRMVSLLTCPEERVLRTGLISVDHAIEIGNHWS